MNIHEIYLSSHGQLPLQRNTNDFQLFLDRTFADYTCSVRSIDTQDSFSQGVLANIDKITAVMDSIKSAVNEYLQGHPSEAFRYISDGIESIEDELRVLATHPHSLHELPHQHLYRIRKNGMQRLGRGDIFHVPFEKRHFLKTQRYSIAGLPCLYLGGSSWVCWEEMNRPEFHNIHISRFEVKEPIQILDFGYRPLVIAEMSRGTVPQGSKLEKLMVAHATCWPLIAACSIKVYEENASFIHEYIVPQLVLQWITLNREWDGIRYFSTQVSESSGLIGATSNFVFPVKSNMASGFCAELTRKFHLSEPIPWEILRTCSPSGGIQSKVTQSFDLELAKDVISEYHKTDFCKVEIGCQNCSTSSL